MSSSGPETEDRCIFNQTGGGFKLLRIESDQTAVE